MSIGRPKLPPRVYLDPIRRRWQVRYENNTKRTPFTENQKDEAEAYLAQLLLSPRALFAKRKPGVAKVDREFGQVYFVSKDKCDIYPIKIGFSTNNTYMRLKNIQVGNPEPLAILATVDCHHSDEVVLHKLLAADRIRGEWHVRSQSVRDVLEQARAGTLLAFLRAMDGECSGFSATEIVPVPAGVERETPVNMVGGDGIEPPTLSV